MTTQPVAVDGPTWSLLLRHKGLQNVAEERNYVDIVRDGAFLAKTPRDRLNMGALGLAGECGEVVELIKKHLYHGAELKEDRLREELGDLLFYLALIAGTYNVTLSGLAFENIWKLRQRWPDNFPDPAEDVVVRL